MANISDSNGKIRISLGAGESKEDMVKTWNIIKKFWGYGEYGAFFDEISDKDVCEDMDGVYAEADFSGTGRWSFENNVESFGRWIESTDAITDDEKDFLRDRGFSIRYDFCDYEMGCEVFYEATMENVHEKGTSLGSINGECLSYEDIDITADNLIDYAGYSEDEVADMNMPREELKQWFFDNDSSENEQIEAVFDNDEAYRQLMQDERGTIFWPYDDNIDWDAYIDEFCKSENENERITIRKVDSPDRTNDGLVYGAFNSHGTPVGKRFRTAEECRKSFEKKGYSNFSMPKNEKGKER